MADSKITGLTADTSPTTDDLVTTVNDPGGTPANRKVTVGNLMKSNLITNPYNFRAYHSTTQNSGSGGYADMSFNTESWDVGSNFASNVFTAPINGYYLFGAGARTSSTTQRFSILIVASANGPNARGNELFDDDNHSGSGVTATALMYLAANDTVKVQSIGNTTLTIDSGNTTTYFWGFLVSIA